MAKKDQDEKKASPDEQIKDLTDTLQRLQAEFENYKKRVEKENASFRQFASAQLIDKLLPIIDSFEMALRNADGGEKFSQGMKLIFGQLYDLLEKEGLRPIMAVGQKFDPYRHEVLLTEKTDKEEGDERVVEELQKGYMLHDRVLRYAKVKITKKGGDHGKENQCQHQ